MKYIDAEKLKAEIKERLHCNGSFDECGDTAWDYDQGMVAAYNYVLSFIDSLQQEQPGKVDFEDVWKTYYDNHLFLRSPMPSKRDIARHFFELGQQEMRCRITNPEYNAKVVEQLKSEYPTTKEDG